MSTKTLQWSKFISLIIIDGEYKMAKAETAKPLTKTEIIANIVAATELPKKDVVAVFDALTEEIKKSFGKRGAKAFVLPGLIKRHC